MNFTKLASLFAFVTLSVLALGFASAQVLTFTPSTISQNIVAGQNATINFNLNYSGSSPTVNLTWTSSITSGTITTPSINSINQGQLISVSSTISLLSSASGTITGSINVISSNGDSAGLPITITVNQPSANITITPPSAPVNINQNASLIVTNAGNTPLSITMSETNSPLFGVTFNPRTFSLASSQPQTVQALLTGLTNLKFGLNNIGIKADAGTQSATSTFQVKKTFCSSGETLIGNLSLSNIEWSNDGEGEDNNWELLDEIELEVEVKNNNDDDDIDTIVEMGLFDSSGKNVADDLIFLDDSDSDNEEIEININDNDEETVTWRFKVPADLDKGDYKLAIKAYSDDVGEGRDCRDSSSHLDDGFFQAIKVEEASDEGRFVIVDEISMDSQVSCGQTATGQFTVFNIGEEDQDRVRILIRNKDLGIDLTREITSDLDRGDGESLDFSFKIPSTASNGNYVLEFITEYDYKNGVYREESENSFDSVFEVLGCSQNLGTGSSGGLTNLDIDAELGSDARAGEELKVIATIKNTGTEDATYSLSARGYSSWAELTDISEGTISVDAGESKEVIFTMLVNEDSSGTQSFDIQVAQDGRVQIQEVEVKLSEAKSSLFNSSNSLIWIIGAVNLILIILIIVVAIKLARR
ncbi:MAG: putative S-layer protein [Nanoarchaeota archaeon]